MDFNLTYQDYTEMLVAIDKDISRLLARIRTKDTCIEGNGSFMEQLEACQAAGTFYKKELRVLLKAKLDIAIERGKLLA